MDLDGIIVGRMKALFAGRWTLGQVVAFHTAHKFVLLAHSEEGYRSLGRLVADGRTLEREALAGRYQLEFMKAMASVATPETHANVLMHMVGHFRGLLDPATRDEILARIDEYRRELVPLAVPVALVRHHARRLGIAYLTAQAYLEPSPPEIALRDHR
jgi:uncharacterized protein YbgA (DUF1722 family)